MGDFIKKYAEPRVQVVKVFTFMPLANNFIPTLES